MAEIKAQEEALSTTERQGTEAGKAFVGARPQRSSMVTDLGSIAEEEDLKEDVEVEMGPSLEAIKARLRGAGMRIEEAGPGVKGGATGMSTDHAQGLVVGDDEHGR